MGKFKDLTGVRIGRWVVLSRAANVGPSTIWNCRCSCGTERPVRAAHLSSGASKSCGCVRPPRKHGAATAKPEGFPKKYRTWRSIRARCNNPNHKNAGIYHGKLCDEWQDYRRFAADVPDPPDDSLTIDRIDNEKGYEPGNVRWVSFNEQHRNQRNCKWITYNGQTKLLTEWARELGVSPSTLSGRYKKYGNVNPRR